MDYKQLLHDAANLISSNVEVSLFLALESVAGNSWNGGFGDIFSATDWNGRIAHPIYIATLQAAKSLNYVGTLTCLSDNLSKEEKLRLLELAQNLLPDQIPLGIQMVNSILQSIEETIISREVFHNSWKQLNSDMQQEILDTWKEIIVNNITTYLKFI